jgi:hypothetical protein
MSPAAASGSIRWSPTRSRSPRLAVTEAGAGADALFPSDETLGVFSAQGREADWKARMPAADDRRRALGLDASPCWCDRTAR